MIKSVKKGNRTYTYDTETATEIKTKTFGTFGDPAGYSETLYQGTNRQYFVYGVGGASLVRGERRRVPLSRRVVLHHAPSVIWYREGCTSCWSEGLAVGREGHVFQGRRE